MPQVVPGAQDPLASRQAFDDAVSASPASREAVVDVLNTGGTTGTVTDLVGRELTRQYVGARERLGLQERSPVLSAEEATERFGIEGQLTFNRPMTEREAAWRQAAKRDELFRLDILQRNDSVGGLEAFGQSMAGALVDPVMIPFNFIPAVGQGSLLTRLGLGAGAATRGGAVLRGLTIGAAEGAVIGGAQEGLVYGLAAGREGRDYSVQDLMLGVTANALFGGTARGAVEGMGWRAPDVAMGPSERVRVTRNSAAPVEAVRATGTVADLIRTSAGRRGENADTAVRIAQLESSLGENRVNPSSNARGVFQFMPDTWAEFGGGDRMDDALNIQNGIRLQARNRSALRRSLGRDPQEWELYLAHQQGSGGAAAMLRDPDRPAVDVLRGIGAKNALNRILQNGGRADMTAGEFAGLWRSKFEGANASAPGAPVSIAAAPQFDPVPAAVEMMSSEARLGAMARALEDMEADRAVNVGPLIESELARGGRNRPALDEAPDAPVAIRARLLDEDVAVSVRGTEIPVRYAIVEAEDLITSHDDDLISNPEFPDELQPRDRERAGSQARLLRMEKEFNPRRLMTTADAESGAPIVAKDGVVESGNGRSIMLRRNMRRGTAVDTAYRGELSRRGFDLTGFERPVLVRIRTEPMEGRARVRLASEMNGDVTERLSATEQAFADAQAIDDNDLALFQGGEITAVPNDAFARRFIDKAGAGQENDLVDGATQRLSLSGVDRVQAAMVARAYGDRALVYALFETQDNTIKAIGKGLMGAAPDWARMRAASARGELAVGADTTEALTAAVALVRHARENRIKLGELVEDWADQDRLLGGEALSPSTKAYLRTFFRDDALKSPSSAPHIAETLRATAARALDTTPGPDLFGDTHAFDAATILERTSARLRQEAGDADAGLFGEGTGAAPDADRGGNGERQPEASGGPQSESGPRRGEAPADAGAGNRPDRQPVTPPESSGRDTWGDEVERFELPDAKGKRTTAAIVLHRRGDEWGAQTDYNAPTMGGGRPPRFFASRDEAMADAVANLRRHAEGREDFSAGDNAAFARIRGWLDETFGEAEASAASTRPPADPELQEIEAEISNMEAELAVYVGSGRLDPDVVAAIGDDLVDQETLQLAIDTAAACLAEGGA